MNLLRDKKTLNAILGEFTGTLILLISIVGSGISVERLTKDRGLELAIHILTIVVTLAVLIWLFKEVSGSHFNPVVSIIAVIRGELSIKMLPGYLLFQVLGALAGTALANAMYKFSIFQSSHHLRNGDNLLLGEIIATAGLILIVFSRFSVSRPMSLIVPAWIAAACFFTSSTSFANPAVTFARAFTNTYAGIAPASVLGFIVAEVIGAFVGLILVILLQ